MNKTENEQPSARRDMAVVAVVACVTFLLSSVLELNERVLEFTRPLEAYQIDELPTTFAAMIIALAWFSWRRSRQSIEQANLRLAAQRQLAEALTENRRLSQRYVQVQEEERRYLARELHDELGQSLNAIKVDAVNIRDTVSTLPEVSRSAEAIIDVSTRVYDVVRGLLRQLRPVALDELGLATAVQYLVDEWQRRHKEVECQFIIDGELDGLDEDLNITVYRFVQECLTNVARHARAQHVAISLRLQREGTDSHSLEIYVEDDGIGVDPNVRRTGLGLIGLRERVEAQGGKFGIAGVRESGARVSAKIPLPDKDKDLSS